MTELRKEDKMKGVLEARSLRRGEGLIWLSALSRATPLVLLTLSVCLNACGGGSQQVNAHQLQDAQRERDALRVAYEAQQLRIKELSDRIIALEDRVMLKASSQRGVRGAGLWGRSRREEPPRALPTVRLSELSARRPKVAHRREAPSQDQEASSAPPSAQLLREARIKRAGQADRDGEVPTLTAHNIDSFKKAKRPEPTGSKDSKRLKRAKRAKRVKRTHPAPQGAALASSLGVIPVPPRPSEVQLEPQPPSREVQRAVRARGDEVRLAQDEPLKERLSTPKDPLAVLLSEAQTSLSGRRYSEAKRAFKQVLSSSPRALDRSKARFGLAQVAREQGHLSESISILKGLIQGDPSGPLVPRALLEIGALQLRAGQSAQGRATLTRLKSLYPNTAAARRAEALTP